MTTTNDFTIWADGVPMLDDGGSPEFEIWADGVPMLDNDEGEANAPRRRVTVF